MIGYSLFAFDELQYTVLHTRYSTITILQNGPRKLSYWLFESDRLGALKTVVLKEN